MKRYLTGLAAVVGILILAVIALPWLIPLEYDKDEIIAEVKSITGRDLTIDGPIRLSLFPLSIKAHGVMLGNPAGSRNPAMIRLDTIDLELRLLPLLSGRLDIARFILRKPEIDLEIARSGAPNWVFAHPADQAASASPSPPSPEQPASGGSATAALGRLSIAKMHIEDGTLNFVNDRNGTGEKVSGLNLDIVLPGANGQLKVSGNGTVDRQRYSISLSGVVSLSDKGVALGNASVKFDSISGTGNLAVEMSGVRPRVTGDLALHRLDVTPYMAAPKPAEARAGRVKGQPVPPPPPPPQPAGWDERPIDFSPLGRVDADLHVTADEIRVRKFDLGQTDLHLVLADQHLKIDLAKLSAYGGHGSGVVEIAGPGPQAVMGLHFSLGGIQIQPALKDSTSFDRLSGNASWTTTLKTTGGSERELIGNLAGHGDLQLVNGSLRGFNIVQMLANPVGDVTEPKGSTTIEHMTCSYDIVSGIVTNHDLDVKSGKLTASGEGTIDLPSRSLYYQLKPRLGIAIPIRISGPWSMLHYRMDMNVLKDVSKPVDAVRRGVGSSASKLKSLLGIP
jgi:AsmA protein